jgi:excisionase family DNA binding protein
MTAEERWVGVEDVAKHLGVNKDSVYRWIDKMGLPAHRLGRLFRFKISEVDEWVLQGNGGEKATNSAHIRPLSKSQANQSKPKTEIQKSERSD